MVCVAWSKRADLLDFRLGCFKTSCTVNPRISPPGAYLFSIFLVGGLFEGGLYEGGGGAYKILWILRRNY